MEFQTIPILRIFDEDKARDFYVEFLGMTIDWQQRAHKVLTKKFKKTAESLEEHAKQQKFLQYRGFNHEHMKNLAIDWKLLDHPDVVYTPHIAFYSEEALKRILDTTAENILGHKKGVYKHSVY